MEPTKVKPVDEILEAKKLAITMIDNVALAQLRNTDYAFLQTEQTEQVKTLRKINVRAINILDKIVKDLKDSLPNGIWS